MKWKIYVDYYSHNGVEPQKDVLELAVEVLGEYDGHKEAELEPETTPPIAKPELIIRKERLFQILKDSCLVLQSGAPETGRVAIKQQVSQATRKKRKNQQEIAKEVVRQHIRSYIRMQPATRTRCTSGNAISPNPLSTSKTHGIHFTASL